MNNDLISRSALLEAFSKYDVLLSSEIRTIVNLAPTILSAREVTRCKDCTLYGPSPYGHPTIGWCRFYGSHRNPEFFCGFADKEGEK